MVTIASISPHHSASRHGGEHVEITGTGLAAVTKVAFGPWEGAITQQDDTKLLVTAPEYRPGWGGHHGEVIVWADIEHTRSGVIWTWEGKTLEELGGPLDAVDQAIGLASVPDNFGNQNDPVNAALKPADAAEPAAGTAPPYCVVDSFEPTVVPSRGDWITLHGRGFTGATGVTIGSFHCPQFEVRSDTTVVALVPQIAPGTSELTVTPYVWHGDIASFTAPNPVELRWSSGHGDNYSETIPFTTAEAAEYDREHPLHIVSVNPQGSATLAGGEHVTVHGTGFEAAGVDEVYLGGHFSLRDFTVVSDTELTFTAPAWTDHVSDHKTYRHSDGVGVHGKDGTSAMSGVQWTWGGKTAIELEEEQRKD